MAYGNDRSGVLRQRPFERSNGVYVKMVGGLVRRNERDAVDDAASYSELSQLSRAGLLAFEDAIGV